MHRGTIDEIVAASLLPSVTASFEFIGAMQHLGSWSDVVQKAKRLIMSGQVTLKANTPTYVWGHVIGDHGEYDCEISRHDPSSSIIEQWNCQCPWNQYAFNRTRKWKRLEGRVCSHVLALYWKGKATPLDGGSFEDGPVAPFQRTKPLTDSEMYDQSGGQLPISEEQADSGTGLDQLPRTYTPDDAQPIVDLPAQRQDMMDRTQGQPIAPQQNAVLPKPPTPAGQPAQPAVPQRQQLQLFDLTAPPGYAPVAPTNPVSIPGGRPPSPTNPIGLPGALSSVKEQILAIYSIPPLYSLRTSEFIYAANEFEQWVNAVLQTGAQPTVQLRFPQMLEQRGGKIPVPNAHPQGTSEEGVALYHYLDLGWHPELQRRVKADEFPGGAPEQRGIYSEAQSGRRGSVVDIEPSLKMVRVQIPLRQSGKLMPHYLEGWVTYDDVVAIPDAPEPFKVRA